MKKGDTGYIVHNFLVWSVKVTACGPETTRFDWYETRNVTIPYRGQYDPNRPRIGEVSTHEIFSDKKLALQEAIRQIRWKQQRLENILLSTVAILGHDMAADGQVYAPTGYAELLGNPGNGDETVQ